MCVYFLFFLIKLNKFFVPKNVVFLFYEQGIEIYLVKQE